MPLLTPDVEPVIYEFLREQAESLEAKVFALNGVEDHVHMVVAIPPKIAVARFIGQVKAVASLQFNRLGLGRSFFWQEEYGVFSLSRQQLPACIAYVNRQKKHHAQGSTIALFEGR
jgi:REP element-mobilizing transposase RayT